MKKGFFNILSDQNEAWYPALSQKLILMLCLISVPYVGVFWLISKKMALCIFPLIGLYLSSYLLIKKGYSDWGRWSFLIWLNVGVIFYSSSFGRPMGIQMLFFAFLLLPLMMFSVNERSKMIGALPIPVIAFAVLEASNYSLSPVSIHAPDLFVRWVNATGYLVVMGILLSYSILFGNTIIRIKNKRDQAVIRATKAELVGIKKTVALLQHEINNALMGVLNGALLLENRLKNNAELFQLAAMIKVNSQRIASIIQKIEAVKESKTSSYVGGIKMLDVGDADMHPNQED